MTAIIIDDEPHCVDYLQVLIQQHCPSVEVVATAQNGVEGLQVIAQYAPQLVFLDIEMPVMNGFRMLEELGEIPFRLIFTTAYDRYALRAFKFSALDYLLKPIDAQELKGTMARILKASPVDHEQLGMLKSHLQADAASPFSNKIAIAGLDGYTFLNLDQVIYCEAESNYTWFHLVNGKSLMFAKNLGTIEDALSRKGFLRIHKHFLVNLTHVEKYVKSVGGHLVMSNGKWLDIARSRRKEFVKLFGRF